MRLRLVLSYEYTEQDSAALHHVLKILEPPPAEKETLFKAYEQEVVDDCDAREEFMRGYHDSVVDYTSMIVLFAMIAFCVGLYFGVHT